MCCKLGLGYCSATLKDQQFQFQIQLHGNQSCLWPHSSTGCPLIHPSRLLHHAWPSPTSHSILVHLLPMLYWWMRFCALHCTATNCHLLDPALIAEGRAHQLYQKFEKNHSKICQFNCFWVKHTFSPLYRSKLTSREGRDATGTYVDLVWCQHERLAHLCREEEQTPLLPSTFANDERYQQHISPTSLSRYSLSRHLRLQP